MESIERVSPKQGYRDILRLMLPCLAELLLGQLVSMVDMIMVGGIGTQAINAVGICGNPTMLLMMIFTALNVGTTALISRAKGEGNIYKANQVARLALIVNLLAGAAMLGLGLIFTNVMIRMMGVNLSFMADVLLRWVLFSGRYRMGKWKTVKLK